MMLTLFTVFIDVTTGYWELYSMTHFDKYVRVYATYSKSKILQIAVLDYFLISMFTNTLFQFSEYVKQL